MIYYIIPQFLKNVKYIHFPNPSVSDGLKWNPDGLFVSPVRIDGLTLARTKTTIRCFPDKLDPFFETLSP